MYRYKGYLHDTSGEDLFSRASDQANVSVAIYMHDMSAGGVERTRLRLIPELVRQGASVTLLLHSRRGPLATQLPHDLPVISFEGKGAFSDTFPLARYLRRARPHLLVSSLDHNNVVALLASMLSGAGIPLIICQHNALSSEVRHFATWKYKIIPWLYRLLHWRARAVVCVSNGVAEDLRIYCGIEMEKLIVIYNAVLDDAFQSNMAEPVDHPWFQSKDVPVFVAVGRLVPQKDPITLIDAFARRLKKGLSRLILVGTGPMQRQLEEKAYEMGVSEQIFFAGFKANPLPYIREASALVLSSRYEGLGNVLIEALGCGTPIISTDCPFGPAEIIENGKYGRLVPVGDVEAMAKAMEGDLRKEFPAPLLCSRASDFTVRRSAERYMEAFRGAAFPRMRTE